MTLEHSPAILFFKRSISSFSRLISLSQTAPPGPGLSHGGLDGLRGLWGGGRV